MEAPSWATHVAKWTQGETTITVWVADGLYQYEGWETKEYSWSVDDWKCSIEHPSYKGTVLPIEPVVLENK